jgi:hypothetical protein
MVFGFFIAKPISYATTIFQPSFSFLSALAFFPTLAQLDFKY